VALFTARRLEFDPSPDHVGFVVDKVAVRQVVVDSMAVGQVCWGQYGSGTGLLGTVWQ
jgi:hypothetical protein